eukprot:g19538.t1
MKGAKRRLRVTGGQQTAISTICFFCLLLYHLKSFSTFRTHDHFSRGNYGQAINADSQQHDLTSRPLMPVDSLHHNSGYLDGASVPQSEQ